MNVLDPEDVPVEVRRAHFDATRTRGGTETISGMNAAWTESPGRGYRSHEVLGGYLVIGEFRVNAPAGSEVEVSDVDVVATALTQVRHIELTHESHEGTSAIVWFANRSEEVPQTVGKQVLFAGR